MYNIPIQELLAQHHLIRYSSKYQYDELFALGIVTVINQVDMRVGEQVSPKGRQSNSANYLLTYMWLVFLILHLFTVFFWNPSGRSCSFRVLCKTKDSFSIPADFPKNESFLNTTSPPQLMEGSPDAENERIQPRPSRTPFLPDPPFSAGRPPGSDGTSPAHLGLLGRGEGTPSPAACCRTPTSGPSGRTSRSSSRTPWSSRNGRAPEARSAPPPSPLGWQVNQWY